MAVDEGELMMKKFSTIGLSLAALTIVISLPAHSAELCRLQFGVIGNNACGHSSATVLLSREMKGKQKQNEDICTKSMGFLSDDASYDKWTTVGDDQGKIHWQDRNFIDNYPHGSDALDDNGNFRSLAGKTLVLCFRTCKNNPCDWKYHGEITVPKSPEGDCGGGMEWVNGACQDANATGDHEPGDFLGVLTIGTSAIVAGNEHNSDGEVPGASAVNAGGGLLAEDGSGPGGAASNAGSGLSGLLNNGLSSLGNMLGLKSPSSGSGGSLGGSGSSGPDSQVPGMVAYGLSGLAENSNSEKSAQGAGGSGSGSKFGGSAIGGSGDVGLANSDNSNQQMQYGSENGRKLASLSGAENPNADDGLDYFTRIGLGDDIFKVVEKKYRDKQTGWIVLKK